MGALSKLKGKGYGTEFSSARLGDLQVEVVD